MKKHGNTKRFLSLLLIFCMLLSMTAMVSAAETEDTEAAGSVDAETAKAALAAARQEAGLVQGSLETLDPDEKIRVIVETSFAPVVELMDAAEYTTSAQSAETSALNQQKSVIEQAEAITGGEVLNQSAYLVNTFTMEMTVAQMQKVSALKNVTAVYPVTKFELKMNYAGQMTTVTRMWEELGYTGEGMVIAVIDTGVAVNHPDMKLSEGTRVKITREDAEALIGQLGYGQYYSDKVPFAYSYTGFYEMDNSWATHGLHVSGIAAGNGGDSGVTGVAPDAQILGLQVFSSGGSAYTDDIIRAVEDAVKLGADVMNLSLGSTAGFYGDINFLQEALDQATADGVLCCVAAGNDGCSASLLGINTNDLGVVDTGAVSTPSTAPGVLSVASVNNAYYKANAITAVDENGIAMTGTAFNFSQVYDSRHESNPSYVGWDLLDDMAIVDCGLGTDEDVSDHIDEMIDYLIEGVPFVALVKRGDISFADKIENCSLADAVIIYNNEESDYVPNNVSSEDAGLSYGMMYQILVSGNFGAWLKERAVKGLLVSFGDLAPTNVAASDGGEISEFSSWGPTPTLEIKPEISAPGGNIYSLSSNGSYETMSGTSMATPYVSGASALVLEALQDAEAAGTVTVRGMNDAQFVKLALMNTADPILYRDETRPYSVRQQGAGMVDPAGAARTTVLATCQGLGSAALKEVGSTASFTIDLTNYGAEDRTYTLSPASVYTEDTLEDGTYTVKQAGDSTITYSASTVTVPAGGKASVTATLTVSGLEENHYVEGFVTLEGQDCETLNLPVLGFYGDWYGAEDIIDAPVYTGEGILSNAVGLPATTLASGQYYAGMTTDGEVVPEGLSFSPNGDGEMDDIYPLLGMLRGAEKLTAEILDESQTTLRTIISENYVTKVLGVDANDSEEPYPYITVSDSYYGWGVWDGTVYNRQTGFYDPCPEGQYFMKITANMPGSSRSQTVVMPVKIDLTAPAVEILSVDAAEGKVTVRFTASDEVGLYGDSMVYINGSGIRFDLGDVDFDEASGVYTLTVSGKNYVSGQMNEIALVLQDFAANTRVKYFYTGKDAAEAVTYATLTNAEDEWYDSFQFTDRYSSAERVESENGEWMIRYYWDIRGVVSGAVANLTVDGIDVEIGPDGSFSILRPMVFGQNAYAVEARDSAGAVLVRETKLLYYAADAEINARFYPSCYSDPERFKELVPASFFISSSWEDFGVEHNYGYYTRYEEVVPITVESDGMVKSVQITYFDPEVYLTRQIATQYYDGTDHIDGASYCHLTLTADDFTQGEDGLYYATFDFPMPACEVNYEGLGIEEDPTRTPRKNYGFITLTDITGYESRYLLYATNDVQTDIIEQTGSLDDFDILGSGRENIMHTMGFNWVKPLDDMDYPYVFTPEDLDENGCVHITGEQIDANDFYANGEKVNTDETGKQFAFDYRLEPGANYMTGYQVEGGLYGGVTSYTWILYYLPEPTSLTFDQKGICDGAVLYTYADTFELSGCITGYMTGQNLDINGENVILGGAVLSAPEGKAKEFPFAAAIPLELGSNPVHVKMDNSAGELVELYFTIVRLNRYEVSGPEKPVVTNPVEPPVTDADADCPSKGFRDVNTGLWYHEAIDFVVSEGLFNGTSANTFSPDLTMTRAMFVTVLGRLDGVDPDRYTDSSFTDVAPGQWYSPYVEWASQNEIVNGLGNGRFGPEQTITREQAAAILYRYAVYAGLDVSGAETAVLNSFADRDQISDWAVTPMAWAVQNGILQGSNGSLTPNATATRAQVAQILMKFSRLLNK